MAAAILFASVVWTFWPALRGNFLYFDDNAYVLSNSHVNHGLTWEGFLWSFTGVAAANWHPLTWLSHMADVQMWGENPWGHHLTSVLLHGFNTSLVFLVFQKLTGGGWRCVALAALFGLHPLRVESVEWICERKDVLSALFWLLATWAYAKFARALESGGKWKLSYNLTLSFFALGLASKTMLVTLPFVFLLLDFWPLRRWESKFKLNLLLEKTPFFLLAIAVSFFSFSTQQSGGMMKEMSRLTFADRCGNALVSYVRYLEKIFWPENLCILYPHPGHWPLISVLSAGLLIAGVSIFTWLVRVRRPWWFVGWFWYLGTLVPVIGLIQLSSQAMADRYTYIPAIGIALIVIWECCELTKHLPHRTAILGTATVAVLIVCVALTRYETGFWLKNIAVWQRAIVVTKDNYVAYNNLGFLLKELTSDGGVAEFQESVRINPNFEPAQKNLGLALYEQGRDVEAIDHFQQAVRLDPNDVVVCYNMAQALNQTGQIVPAIHWFEETVRLKPDFPRAYYNLGFAYHEIGKLDEAIAAMQKEIRVQPAADSYNELGALLLEKGRADEALTNLQMALKLNPDFAPAKSNFDFAVQLKARNSE